MCLHFVVNPLNPFWSTVTRTLWINLFKHPHCLFLSTSPYLQSIIHLLVSPGESRRRRDLLDFPVASLSLPLIAVGITGRQGQNGLQRLWFHCCFPNWLFSPCTRSPSTPKFPHLPPSHPAPRLGNGIKNKRFSPKIDAHFQEKAGLNPSLFTGELQSVGAVKNWLEKPVHPSSNTHHFCLLLSLYPHLLFSLLSRGLLFYYSIYSYLFFIGFFSSSFVGLLSFSFLPTDVFSFASHSFLSFLSFPLASSFP